MTIETPSTIYIEEPEKKQASLITTMLRLNGALGLAGLVISFFLTIPVALRYEKSSALTILDGKLSLDFERFITKEHPYRDPALNSWAAAELVAFNAGQPGVIIGSNGWLFTLEEFPLPSSRKALMTQNLDTIKRTVELLRSKGIEVVLLPIPAKADIYKNQVPEKLQSRVLTMTAVTDYLALHKISWIPVEADLRRASALGTAIFFHTETHWTPDGARIVAEKTASWLQAAGKMDWPVKTFEVIAGKPLKLGSDLENFIPVKPTFASLLPAPESYTPYKTVSTEIVDDASALFGDAGRPVALVGTSYSADERWNFSGWLRNSLHTDIDNISEKARGPFLPMEKFIHMQSTGATQAKLVIWELPVRSLTVDYIAMAKQKTH